jgi:LDH2 family malate/lactate/ureidoglycolate dehydrogenase
MELDLATSVTSRANIVEAARKGLRLPEGWAQDDNGNPTRNPKEALQGSLLPFGGEKGFGLLVALEALTGVLSGGAYADLVASKEASPAAPEGTCYTLIAIDLAHAMQVSDFTGRLSDMFERIASLPMRADSNPPRYPGERRWKLRKERVASGIPLSASDVEDISSLANELGIEAP